jgi:hypothetical protein
MEHKDIPNLVMVAEVALQVSEALYLRTEAEVAATVTKLVFLEAAAADAEMLVSDITMAAVV